MKKTKLAVLFTAFMAMMGLSSCLGDPDPYNYGTEYVKIIPSEYGYSFMSSGRIILNPTDQSLVGTSLIGKEYAWINYKYEREAVTQSDKEIDITLQYPPVAIEKIQDYGRTEESNSYFDYVALSQYAFPFYDANTMFLDLQYDVNKVDNDELGNELANHYLDITRLEEQCTSDKVVLKIHHDDLAASEDKDNDKQDYGEIRYINLYSLLQGQVPDKLVLKFNIYDGNNDKIKEDSCVVDYKAIVDTYFKNQF